MASGASGVVVEPESEDELRFGEALDYAAAPARDPHGPRRRGRAPRRRASSCAAADAEGVERVAREVANSPLVKTAIYGGDPNWGRIAQAIGAALPGTHPLVYDIRVEGTLVCSGGYATARAGRVHRRRGRDRDHAAGRRRGDRGLLLRPRARVHHHQRRLHDLRRTRCATSRHSSRRCRTSASSTAARSSSSTAARRWTTRRCARTSRATSCSSSTSGWTRSIVHGGGPEITSYMQRLDMPVEFVGGLRVSDKQTVEVAKMVLVGKVNKDIVGRINRHGQPAVGLSGDDGQLFRAVAHGGAGRRGHRLRRAHRARRRRRHPPHRARLHPGHRVGRRRPRGQLVQRQRRRGRRRRGPRDRGVQAHLPHRRHRLAARQGRPGARSSARPAPTRSRPRSTASSAGCAPSSRRAVDAIHGGVSSAHIIDGRVPHSLLLELFTDAGVGTKIRPAAVSGEHLLGTYARFPVTFERGEGARLWDSEGNEYLDFLTGISVSSVGHRHPGGRGGDRRAGRQAAARRQPLLHRADVAAGRPARAELARRRRVLHQQRRRGGRGGAEARAQGQAAAATSSCSRAASTAARTARCRRRRRRASRRRSRRSSPGSSPVAADRRRDPRRGERQHRRGAAWRSSRASPACTRCPTTRCTPRARRATRSAPR